MNRRLDRRWNRYVVARGVARGVPVTVPPVTSLVLTPGASTLTIAFDVPTGVAGYTGVVVRIDEGTTPPATPTSGDEVPITATQGESVSYDAEELDPLPAYAVSVWVQAGARYSTAVTSTSGCMTHRAHEECYYEVADGSAAHAAALVLPRPYARGLRRARYGGTWLVLTPPDALDGLDGATLLGTALEGTRWDVDGTSVTLGRGEAPPEGAVQTGRSVAHEAADTPKWRDAEPRDIGRGGVRAALVDADDVPDDVRAWAAREIGAQALRDFAVAEGRLLALPIAGSLNDARNAPLRGRPRVDRLEDLDAAKLDEVLGAPR